MNGAGTPDSRPDADRLRDLHADEILFGRDAESDRPEEPSPPGSAEDRAELERIASLATLTLLSGADAAGSPSLPPELRNRVLTASQPFVRETRAEPPKPAGPSRSVGFRECTAWFLVFSFALLTGFAWWSPFQRPTGPAVSRERLLAEADALRVDFAQQDRSAGDDVGGDVVWSPDRQAGFLRLEGLPANDPSKQQYQLWIIDAERDPAQPVDGGVFDVPAEQSGEVVVPIDAKLPVGQAVAFAVTIEPPGGVVVSSRERLPLLAVVPGT